MLILVRHGRTSANASGLLQGRVDNPLDELGREQAAAVGEALAGLSIRRVVCSPLVRAMSTASEICSRAGVEAEIDERFIELDYGQYDMVPLADVPAQVWDRWRADASFAPPGGESLLDLRRRVWAGLDDLAEQARLHDIAVVCHTSPIKAAVQWSLGVDEELSWRMRLDPASICRVAVRDRPVMVSFNETAHLAGLSPR